MGLHCARRKGQRIAKGMGGLISIQTTRVGQSCHGTKEATRRRPEEPDLRFSGDTEACGNIDSDSRSRNKARTGQTCPLRFGQQDRDHDGEGVQHGLFVDAIKLERMGLKSIDESRMGRG
jgi:hypothetical protein